MERSVPSREAAEACEWIAPSAWSPTEVGIDPRVAVRIVELTLFFVRKDFVGFCGFLELFGCIFVILSFFRMENASENSNCKAKSKCIPKRKRGSKQNTPNMQQMMQSTCHIHHDYLSITHLPDLYQDDIAWPA